MIETLPLNDVIKDSALQMRVFMDEATIADYADAIRGTAPDEPIPLPPIVVYRVSKKLFVVDGFHRHEAHVRAGATEIGAQVIEGTKRDAMLYSVSANAKHGLRRTNADKRKAVETLLADKECARWSDRQIAEHCAVTHPFVGRIRGELSGNGYQMDATRTVERSGATYQQNTANIGKSVPACEAADGGEARSATPSTSSTPSPLAEAPDPFGAWIELTEQTADLKADDIFAACPVRMRPTLSQRSEAIRAIIDKLDELIERPPIRERAA